MQATPLVAGPTSQGSTIARLADKEMNRMLPGRAKPAEGNAACPQWPERFPAPLRQAGPAPLDVDHLLLNGLDDGLGAVFHAELAQNRRDV